MFTYVAYGLGIHSALELPELSPGTGPADVVIRLGDVPGVDSDRSSTGALHHTTTDETCLAWPEVGALRLCHGSEITLAPAAGADADLLRLYLLGPALGLLLHQRGLLVLHASAVTLDGEATAFLGRSGQGKSTTAAALYGRGWGLVADDIVAVDLGAAGGPTVWPGFPQLKLWPDAVAALGGDPGALPRIHGREEKRAYAASAAGTTPAPLRRIYILADAESLAIELLTGHAAVFALLEHSYVAPALEQLGSSSFLAACARLAAVVPVRRLDRPRTLDGLEQLTALIEAEARPADARAAVAAAR
jgi:hypothetical protein